MRKRFPIKRNITFIERRFRAILGFVVFLIPIMLPIEFNGINWFPVLALIFWLSALFARCPFIDFFELIRKLAQKK